MGSKILTTEERDAYRMLATAAKRLRKAQLEKLLVEARSAYHRGGATAEESKMMFEMLPGIIKLVEEFKDCSILIASRNQKNIDEAAAIKVNLTPSSN
jgi:hypothetical protein